MSATNESASSLEADPRVLLAAERTLLAWIRTGVGLMGFGFVVARFGLFLRELALVSGHTLPAEPRANLVGVALVAAGAVLNVWASVRHRNMIRRLIAGQDLGSVENGPIVVGVATAMGGLVLVVILMGVL